MEFVQELWQGILDVDYKAPSFLLAAAAIAWQPTWWNIAARAEYRTHWLTKLAGSAKTGVYILSVAILSMGLLRDYLFYEAMKEQKMLSWDHDVADIVGYSLMGLGFLLVGTSTWALGWINTFLGDYFGLLMKARVTGFPFNVLSDPMYVGSTLAFFGHAVRHRSPVGFVLASFVWVVYWAALQFEGPFTTMIYREAEKKKKKESSK